MTTTKTKGTKAYYDTFNGLIPCVTLGRLPNGKIQFRLTKSRGAYQAGEILSSSDLWVPPRTAVLRKQYNSVILPYQYEKG